MRFSYYESQVFGIDHHYGRSKDGFKKDESYILMKGTQMY